MDYYGWTITMKSGRRSGKQSGRQDSWYNSELKYKSHANFKARKEKIPIKKKLVRGSRFNMLQDLNMDVGINIGAEDENQEGE
jgi:hypothetical protein